jgi:hypothetical protein
MRWLFLLAVSGFTICGGPKSFAAGKTYDKHERYLLPPDSSPQDCARTALEATIQASQFSQIHAENLRESPTFRTAINDRGEHYFEFEGSDPDSNKFSGYIFVQVRKTYVEDPLTGKRTKYIACNKPYTLLDLNVEIVNINKTPIIRE